VSEAGGNCELIFFPRLRDELRAAAPAGAADAVLRGIRACVKQLTGARRWCGRCHGLHDQIIEFLRSCMTREHPAANCALVVK